MEKKLGLTHSKKKLTSGFKILSGFVWFSSSEEPSCNMMRRLAGIVD